MQPLAFALTLALAAAPAAADPLVPNGSFEAAGDGGAPAGWSVSDGATTGAGDRANAVEWVDAGRDGGVALRVRGDARTVRWQSADSEPFAVSEGASLELAAWMRTDAVRKQGRQFGNCNVGLSVFNASGDRLVLVATRPLQGTHDWTRVATTLLAPAGSATAQAFAFCSMSGTAWFDDLTVTVLEGPGWQVDETRRFIFHATPTAPITAENRAHNEATLAALSERLGATLPDKVRYYRYADARQKEALTGIGGNAHADPPLTLHTLWPVDDHEVVHLLTATWGPTDSALLGEGVAVAMGGVWQGEPVHDWIPKLTAEGRLPPLADLVDSEAFRAQDDLVTYAVAGSFVKWLIYRHGMADFRAAYVGQGDTEARLAQVYGASLAALEAAWLAEVSAE